jgi:hypothetical protein
MPCHRATSHSRGHSRFGVCRKKRIRSARVPPLTSSNLEGDGSRRCTLAGSSDDEPAGPGRRATSRLPEGKPASVYPRVWWLASAWPWSKT